MVDTEGRFSTIDSLLSPPSVSGDSEDSSTSASSRGIYTSDFGPLLLRPTARSSENTYPIWQNQSQLQYPQPPTYGSSQPYIVSASEYPPTSSVPAPSVSPAPTHQELQAYIPPQTYHSLSTLLTSSLSPLFKARIRTVPIDPMSTKLPILRYQTKRNLQPYLLRIRLTQPSTQTPCT